MHNVGVGEGEIFFFRAKYTPLAIGLCSRGNAKAFYLNHDYSRGVNIFPLGDFDKAITSVNTVGYFQFKVPGIAHTGQPLGFLWIVRRHENY